MLRESTRSAILGAALAGDPSVFGEMNEEERKTYEADVKWIARMKEYYGDKFDEMEIDIPYSMGDEDDDDDE